MDLVFWQNILSPHQSPFLRALAEQGYDVTVVAAEAMTADRRALGWKVPDLGRARVVLKPDARMIQELIAISSKEAIHLMAGARWSPLGNEALRHCLKLQRRMGIVSEAPDPRGFAGVLRWAKYTAERVAHGSHYDLVLAMGEMGERWFRRCGYPANRVFPFAYVTEPVSPSEAKAAGTTLSILYVGRFVALKGLDILLRAFAAASLGGVQLRLLGEGPEQTALEGLAAHLGIADRVVWLPKQDATGVQREMAQADVTVLPSRKDGWGAVVNESLMAGTPVICSTACGAAELIQHPWLGTIFESGSRSDLAAALSSWAGKGRRRGVERERVRNWSRGIEASPVARYVEQVLAHVYEHGPKPQAPWRLEVLPAAAIAGLRRRSAV